MPAWGPSISRQWIRFRLARDPGTIPRRAAKERTFGHLRVVLVTGAPHRIGLAVMVEGARHCGHKRTIAATSWDLTLQRARAQTPSRIRCPRRKFPQN